MSNEPLIFLLLMLILIILAVCLYATFGVRHQVVYINQYTNSSIKTSKKSILVLKKHHVNRTLVLDGGVYNIYLKTSLQNSNGVIKVVHLKDEKDTFHLEYKSNVRIVEYEKDTIDYPDGSNPIDGNVWIQPDASGTFTAEYHTTTITLDKNVTSVYSETMITEVSLS
jgi:hypothetical protein